MKPLIQTCTGKLIDLTAPTVADIDIRDIARSLSNLSRFTGHVGFYSVAEHSVGAAALTQFFAIREMKAVEENPLLSAEAFKAGLLHDATEAYLGDVSSPLKSILPEYKRLEEQFHEVITERFRIHTFKVQTEHGVVDLVKAADMAMLELERQRFFGLERDPAWPGFLPGYEIERDTFDELTDGRIEFGRDPMAAWNLFADAWGPYGAANR